MKIEFESYTSVYEGRRINRLMIRRADDKVYRIDLPDNMYYWQATKEELPKLMEEMILPAVNKLIAAYEADSTEALKEKRAQVVRRYFSDRRAVNDGVMGYVGPDV